MDKLAIGLEQDGQLVLDKPVFNKKGWLEKYRLRLTSDDLNAVTRVDNALYRVMLPEFFTQLSNNWKGREGEKSWSALEDEYRIEASTSETGHVTLKVTVNLHQYQWRANAEIIVEAGQLEKIEKDVRELFKFK
jgi:hypothetical protein